MNTAATMLDELDSMYWGEIYGIAFFTYFAQHYPKHPDVWQALIQVEQVTAAHLQRALDQHGYNGDGINVSNADAKKVEQVKAKGMRDAQQWIHLPWPTLVATLLDWVAPYLLHYQQLCAQKEEESSCTTTPNKFQAILDIVVQHETAIYHFLLAEQQQQQQRTTKNSTNNTATKNRDAMKHLTAYVKKHPPPPPPP